jgi:hypothetical protein
MSADARTRAAITVGQPGHNALISTHHHTALLGTGPVIAALAAGALLVLLSAKLVLSWRESGDRLRRILSEFDNH